MNSNTCILLFSRTSASESLHKQLVIGKKQNDKVHQAFLNRALRTAQKTSFPIIRVDERKQAGKEFGQKFYNAIAEVFKAGFENIITIGGDCPNMNERDILFAEKELSEGRQCIGPSKDGGIYLLGISKDYFFSKLQSLSWQTDMLFSDLMFYFSDLGVEVSLLKDKLDIDNSTQFNVILNLLVKQLGFEFLNDVRINLYPNLDTFQYRPIIYLDTQNRRGPPTLQSAA
jgi:hypothetical protein